MNQRMLQPIALLVSFITIFIACDKVKDSDVLAPVNPETIKTTLYTTPNAAVTMDMSSLVQGGTTTMSLDNNAANGTVQMMQNRFLAYTPSAQLTAGKDSFSVKVNGKTVAFNVVVNEPNTLPCNAGAMLDKKILNINQAVTLNVLSNDRFCSGTSATTLRVVVAPSHGTATTTANGEINYQPANNYIGIDTLLYNVAANAAADGSGTALVVFNVVDPNACVMNLVPDAATLTRPATQVTVDILANDILCNLSISTLAIGQQPSNGTVRLENNKAIYTPNANFVGTDVFSYIFRTGSGATVNGFATIIVVDPNVCTVALNPDNVSFTVSSTTPNTTIDVVSNDVLCSVSPATLAISRQPSNGVTSITGTCILYAPSSGFRGIDRFVYSLSGTNGATYLGYVTVTVN